MTTLTRRVTYYFRCRWHKHHRFERATSDALLFCPTCGGPIHLYGLADSTRYSEPDDVNEQGPEVPGS